MERETWCSPTYNLTQVSQCLTNDFDNQHYTIHTTMYTVCRYTLREVHLDIHQFLQIACFLNCDLLGKSISVNIFEQQKLVITSLFSKIFVTCTPTGECRSMALSSLSSLCHWFERVWPFSASSCYSHLKNIKNSNQIGLSLRQDLERFERNKLR